MCDDIPGKQFLQFDHSSVSSPASQYLAPVERDIFFIIITVAHAPIYTYATLADRLDVIEALIDQGLRVLSVGSVLWHPLQSCQGF